uniref:Uncharacterized protein n=1 Tax=Timema cristinae TaxID=61476 RepID=A0A7R9H3X5_TIMCR|nr:unnamed protein product [Timema cristinae]
MKMARASSSINRSQIGLPYSAFTRSQKNKRRTETWSRDANHKISASSARAVLLKFNLCLLLPLCSRCSAQENQSNLKTSHLTSVRMRCRARSKQTASLAFVRRFEIAR